MDDLSNRDLNSPGAEPEWPLLDKPRRCAPDAGFRWLGDAFRLIRRKPNSMLGMAVVIMLIGTLSDAIGSLLAKNQILVLVMMLVSSCLAGLLQGGFMLGCHSLTRRGVVKTLHALEGFHQPYFSRLFKLVCFAVLLGLGVGMLFSLLAQGFFADTLSTLGQLMLRMQQNQPTPLPSSLGGALWSLLFILLALLIPVMMLLWFSFVLLMGHPVGVWEACRRSFQGCYYNLLPGLLYWVALLGLFFAWVVVASLVFSPLARLGSAVIPVLSILILTPVILVVYSSVYTAYLAIFTDQASHPGR